MKKISKFFLVNAIVMMHLFSFSTLTKLFGYETSVVTDMPLIGSIIVFLFVYQIFYFCAEKELEILMEVLEESDK